MSRQGAAVSLSVVTEVGGQQRRPGSQPMSPGGGDDELQEFLC